MLKQGDKVRLKKDFNYQGISKESIGEVILVRHYCIEGVIYEHAVVCFSGCMLSFQTKNLELVKKEYKIIKIFGIVNFMKGK